ncbi:CPBP family intramembrane glutamic endopeptidase [Lactiplantibacillus modestisalitolerans]|uniref:CPBP family intramembrane glutamic endopeptidase n=1 Tax=Lactiplantibacillus modestisalitolerans TaxID=1457219 RepID=A0ABV5WR40_9LACO|nr:CPBP family intramembrane glutamic endopeptidase [Lactiplantibacillus modestisalitolerans]
MAPEIDRLFRRWYLGQLLVLWGFAALQLFTVENGLYFPAGGMVLLVTGLFAWWPAVQEPQVRWRRLRRFNDYWQTIWQMMLLPLLLANMVMWVSQHTQLDQQGLIAMALAYMIIMFVPVAYVVLRNVQSVVGRIALLISAVFSGVVGAHSTFLIVPLPVPAVFSMVSDAGILGAVGFVVTVGILMQAWNFRWPSWRLNRAATPGLLSLMVAVGVLFSLWNAFSNGASWATTFTQWHFHLRAATWKMMLSGLEPGIAEEWLYRFAVLSLLLTAFKQSRWRIDLAVWISGSLFGLWHVTNVLAGQAWSATAEQMLFAAALGWFLAVAYLYSGSLLLPISIHAVLDILSMMASGTQTMTAPNAFEWQTVLVTALLFGGLTLFFLTGQRRQAIQARLRQREPQ